MYVRGISGFMCVEGNMCRDPSRYMIVKSVSCCGYKALFLLLHEGQRLC